MWRAWLKEGTAPSLSILTFHALDERRDAISCPPAVFARGVEMLLAAGHRGVRLAEVAELVRDGSPLPDRCFAISFDDGYRTVFEHAFPILERHGIPATVFVTVGSATVDSSGSPPAREGRSMLTWAQIRELQRHGVEIGAHTLSHPDLTRLSGPAIEREMAGSQTALEDALGCPVRGFAYPFGRFDDVTRAIARSFFAYAVSDRLGLVTAASDVHALERIEMMYFRSERRVRLLRHRALPLYLRALNAPRQLRRSTRAAVRAAVR